MPTASAGKGSTDSGQVFRYFGSLTLLIYLLMPYAPLVDFTTSYMLKNQLHESAARISSFRLITAIPVYLSVAFGLTRDLWNPLGRKDRGFFLIFAPVTAVLLFWMAFSRLSYTGLLTGLLLVMFSFRFVAAAHQGLIALVSQEQLMSGRLSALWNIFLYLPYVAAAFASGYVTENLTPARTFLLLAAIGLLIGLAGLWKPRSVFSHAYDRPQAQGADFWGNVKRLMKHRAVYPAVLINFMWNFSPGTSTPLQFYLTKLHASDAVYGYYNGIFFASSIPMFLAYGVLCKRVSLEKLLWWGTVIAIPQYILLPFAHSANLVMWLAIPSGLMGGVATAAYIDLAMRSCPPGLQGTLMMIVDGVLQLSLRGGDVLGSWIYSSSPTHGFLYCAMATTTVYALILPLLLLIPKNLIAAADGEAYSS